MLRFLQNIKVVKFGDKYALRRGWIGYEYLDLQNNSYWWSRWSVFFKHCLSDDPNVTYMPLYGKPIKKEN